MFSAAVLIEVGNIHRTIPVSEEQSTGILQCLKVIMEASLSAIVGDSPEGTGHVCIALKLSKS